MALTVTPAFQRENEMVGPSMLLNANSKWTEASTCLPEREVVVVGVGEQRMPVGVRVDEAAGRRAAAGAVAVRRGGAPVARDRAAGQLARRALVAARVAQRQRRHRSRPAITKSTVQKARALDRAPHSRASPGGSR